MWKQHLYVIKETQRAETQRAETFECTMRTNIYEKEQNEYIQGQIIKIKKKTR